jgi:hypothetical protein
MCRYVGDRAKEIRLYSVVVAVYGWRWPPVAEEAKRWEGIRMKRRLRRLLVLASILALAMALNVGAASADHGVGPCNGDPVTGQNYGQNHIRAFASHGALGHGGHIPGTHQGFSACNPSGR